VIEATNWRDVKAKARAVDPTWDGAERVARRRRMRGQMLESAEAGVFEAVDEAGLSGVLGT
jgi:hypothetical protein